MNALSRISPLEGREEKRQTHGLCVATVYTIEPFVRTPEEVIDQTGCTLAKRPRAGPEQKRVWASLEKDSEQVIAEALAEARHRDPVGEKIWVALVDGNKCRQVVLHARSSRCSSCKTLYHWRS